jgi:hypothetical protein
MIKQTKPQDKNWEERIGVLLLQFVMDSKKVLRYPIAQAEIQVKDFIKETLAEQRQAVIQSCLDKFDEVSPHRMDAVYLIRKEIEALLTKND